jgi:hypothetical protein
MTERIVISASRRTDIPAFYMAWFLTRLKAGSFQVENPFNGLRRNIGAHPEQVHSLVFWSKDYAPLLERRGELASYRPLFHFTLNSEDRLLEPNVPPLEARLEQMRALTRHWGPDAVVWRFDPVVFYETNGEQRDNLGQFETIAHAAAGMGVRRLVFSFMDPYPKVERRAKSIPGFQFRHPDMAEMVDVALWMADTARELGMEAKTCCEAELLTHLPPGLVTPSACMDHEFLTRLYGPGLSGAPDRGQRKSQGCGCNTAADVGSYQRHPCHHGCLYCYASPARTARLMKVA